MTFITALALALSISSHNGKKETEPQYHQRIETVVKASMSAAEERPIGGSKKKMLALLLTIAKYESGFDKDVHAGDCPKDGCDSGRSATLWQIMYGSWLPRSQWLTFIGVEQEPTTRAAKYAARALSRGFNHCGTVRGAISLYATGKTCYWKEARKREKTYLSFLARL